MLEKLKNKNLLLGIIGVLLIGGTAVGGYCYVNREKILKNKNDAKQSTSSTTNKGTELELPSNFPSETIYPDLVLKSFKEDVNEKGENYISADFENLNLDKEISHFDYMEFLNQLGWEGYAAASSYTDERGQVVTIGHKKDNMDLIVSFYESHINLKVTFTFD